MICHFFGCQCAHAYEEVINLLLPYATTNFCERGRFATLINLKIEITFGL